RRDHRVSLVAGATIVLHTDRLVERRSESLDRRARAIQDDRQRGELAMTASGDVLRRGMVLAPQATAVRQARTLVKEACNAAGTDQVTCDAAVLLTSETVTNAFVHGRSEARLEIAARQESVHV